MLNPQIAIHYTYVKKKYRNCGYGMLLRLKVLMTYDRVITGTNNKSSEYMLRINGKTNFVKIMERQSNCQWFFDKQRS